MDTLAEGIVPVGYWQFTLQEAIDFLPPYSRAFSAFDSDFSWL
jgi:hypothetical protein